MPKGTQYTCPMHPEIVRDKSGACPICGMALEPMGVPTGDEGPNPELGDLRAATQSDLCNRLGGLGADHRLSLAAAMSLSSVSVITNALRLRTLKL
jgi:hypothetical protein